MQHFNLNNTLQHGRCDIYLKHVIDKNTFQFWRHLHLSIYFLSLTPHTTTDTTTEML